MSTPPPIRLLGEGRSALRRELLRLAWPVLLQNVARTGMFLVDTAMLGHVGEEALAALGVAWPVSHTVYHFMVAFSVGALAMTARAWGEGDRLKQEEAGSTALMLAMVIGFPLSLAGLTWLPHAAALFPVPGAPGVTEGAARYLYYEGSAILFFCTDLAVSGILRGAGNTRVPMIAAITGNVVNAALNWVFIFGRFGVEPMGVAGAGLATAAAHGVQALIMVMFVFSRFSPVRLGMGSLARVTRESIRRFARVSLPAAVEPILLQSGSLFFAKWVTLLGASSLAAHRAAMGVESMAFMPGFAFAMAGSTLTGQLLGAGRSDRAEQGLAEATRTAVILMSLLGIVFLVFPKVLVGLFISAEGAEEVVLAAAVCLAISGIEQPFLAMTMVRSWALRGAGDTRSPIWISALGVWGVRVPIGWLLAFPLGFGLTGIWMTMIGDWALRAFLLGIICRRGKWKRINV